MKFIRHLIIVLIVVSCDNTSDRLNQEIDIGPISIEPIPFHEVVLKDDFWQPRMKVQEEVLVPFALDKAGPAIEELRLTGNYLDGDKSELPTPHRYRASDLFKILEGASYILQQNPGNKALEKRIDEVIGIIESAQQDDGYLYAAHITGVSKDHEPWGGGGMGDKPYSWVIHSHELYNMGHLYEAAVAYYQATGKDRLLRVAEKNAQHVNDVFFKGHPDYNDGAPVNQAPGHQEIEIGLMKLFRVTNNRLYLEMAERFLAIRGVTYKPEGEVYMSPEYSQQHLPVAEQQVAVGHAVRAAYMYAGMAEVNALTGITNYQAALNNIWNDIVDRKMSITGGLGAVRGIEGFGPAYELPNKEAHNETCAAVANVFFNYRMFLLTGDAKYLDVAEVSLYNNALAGVNLEGNEFFYVNPLEADGIYKFNHGEPGRSPWFNTACCPSNIARLMPQVQGMMYAQKDEIIFVTLYGANETSLTVDNTLVQLKQETGYPSNGKIELSISPESPVTFTLKLRIPNWARGDQFVPGELYLYVNKRTHSINVYINGEAVEMIISQGFLSIDRTWKSGDKVSIELPMMIRFNAAIDSVRNLNGHIAVTRGPFVLCAEEVDNTNLNSLSMPEDLELIVTKDDFVEISYLKNIPSVQIENSQGAPLLNFIPYFAWNNRGDGAMKVWIPIQSR